MVLGLVGPVGSELNEVIKIVSERLAVAKYHVEPIKISTDVIPKIIEVDSASSEDEYTRIDKLMDAGNEARKMSGDNSVLALGASALISSKRKKGPSPEPRPKTCHLINSLKHPEEVLRLRDIYPNGFYLIGVYASEECRLKYLVEEKRIEREKAEALIKRDENEPFDYGQKLTATFHLSDFFVLSDDKELLKHSLWRIIDLLFGDPYKTPTFDEYAMFLAFSASLRSADLSRQVGAVVANDGDNEVIATGANDCPRFGGGLYWPYFDKAEKEIVDQEDGRDYMRRFDSNAWEQEQIIIDIITLAGKRGIDGKLLREALEESRIRDLSEYGRVVHAEMEALLSCARNGISPRNSTLYTTTFPCHNCAKHIIAAGIKRVVYIEPYPKSKAVDFHADAICQGLDQHEQHVSFEPFIGVGPRRFFDLFSMRLGSGRELKRKDNDGKKLDWSLEKGRLRLQMQLTSYLELELRASYLFKEIMERGGEETDGGQKEKGGGAREGPVPGTSGNGQGNC